MMIRALFLVLLWTQAGYAGGPSDFKVLTENAPPTNYVTAQGELKGSSTEIVQEIMHRIGWAVPIEVYPWARAYDMALEGPRVALFSTTRTEAREPLFKWVGPIFDQRLVLYKLATSPVVIDKLEDAKKVHAIGTYFDDAAEQFLVQHGFSNLDGVRRDELNVRKLVSGRIQLWATGDASIESRIRSAGFMPELFEEVCELRAIKLYIAFSHDTPDAVINHWQNALDAMKEEGLYQEILSKYEQAEE